MVPPIWHAGAVEGPEWDSHAHGTVHPGSGAEDTVIGGGEGEGGHRQVFQRLLVPPRDGDLLQIPRADDLGKGRWLTGGGEEIGPGEDDVEEDF